MKGTIEEDLNLSSTISPIARTNAGPDHLCAHEHSFMKASNPVLFTRFPYRHSLMTLLRCVETRSADAVATKYSGRDPVLAYASFQSHWSPEVNLPVLTIVGACNTNIAPPFFRRLSFEYGQITIMASSSQQQEIMEFKIPLIQTQHDARARVVMEHSDAFDVGDQLTSYVLHPQDRTKPIALIKLWNLSRYGCIELHTTSLYRPPRAKHTDEVHILGLSGDRQTTYRINYPLPLDPDMVMLEELDLQAIGYRQKHNGERLPEYRGIEELWNAPADRSHNMLLARMMPASSTYRHTAASNVIVVPERKVFYKGRIQRKAMFYPPALEHKMGKPFGAVSAMLFPAGFQAFRHLATSDVMTLREAIEDVRRANHWDYYEAIEKFSAVTGIVMSSIEQQIDSTFQKFCSTHHRDLRGPEVPYIVRPSPDSVVPETWVHVTRHYYVNEEEGQVVFLRESTPLNLCLFHNEGDTSQMYTSCTEDTRYVTEHLGPRPSTSDGPSNGHEALQTSYASPLVLDPQSEEETYDTPSEDAQVIQPAGENVQGAQVHTLLLNEAGIQGFTEPLQDRTQRRLMRLKKLRQGKGLFTFPKRAVENVSPEKSGHMQSRKQAVRFQDDPTDVEDVSLSGDKRVPAQDDAHEGSLGATGERVRVCRNVPDEEDNDDDEDPNIVIDKNFFLGFVK